MPFHSPHFTFRHKQTGASIDLLVILLAAIAMFFWIAGNIFLALFPTMVESDEPQKAHQTASNQHRDAVADRDRLFPNQNRFNIARESSDAAVDEPTNGHPSPENTDDVAAFESGEKERSRQAVNDADARFEAKLATKEKEVIRLRAELAELQEAFERYKNDAASLTPVSVDDSSSKVNELSAELATVRNELIRVRQQLAAQHAELEAKDSTVTPNDYQNANIIEQLETKNRQLNAELTLQKKLLSQLKDVEISNRLPAPLFRKWLGKNGRTVEMAFIRRDASGDFIFIGRNNQLFSVPPSRLSEEDLTLVKSAFE